MMRGFIDQQDAARKIQREVAAEWGMTREKMLFAGKSAGKVDARRTAMVRCRQELGMGYADIGRAFNMHHTTVMHHLKRVAPYRRDIVPQLRETLQRQAEIIADQARAITALSESLRALRLSERAA
jgi:chromosomal replication initiation ATPase DnaA